MNKISRYVFENTVDGKIDKYVGADLLGMLESGKDEGTEEIAIIGMSIRVPQAETLDQYWELLKNGKDCIKPFPAGRMDDLRGHAVVSEPEAYAEGGYLPEIDAFDYSYFKISPKEASLMDPSQRIFLETAWKAIEDAGYGGTRLKGSKTGVYVGYNGLPSYYEMIERSFPELMSIAKPGNIAPLIAGRLAYLFDFSGPNMMVDTACSSSLVAVHLACRALRNKECSTALAGGIRISLMPTGKQSVLDIDAPDYRAKAFDEKADGTSWGEGAAAVLLKPVAQALADGDQIYAVIKGSATNHDGNSIGITAPNAKAQEELIVAAWEDAKVEPETITYIEAHGTGTKLGDPIEIEGMKRAFGRFTNRKSFCAVSSVKPNIGHLDSASGLIGLMKAVLAIKHGVLPPSVHYNKPNPNLKIEDSPVYVNASLSVWNTGGTPRRCGVSAFGISGTNCHVVLEEPPISEAGSSPQTHIPHILALSAKTRSGLERLILNYSAFLQSRKQVSVVDLCYTANTGRGHYEHRLAIIVRHLDDLKNALQQLSEAGLPLVPDEARFYNSHKIITEDKQFAAVHEITESEKRSLSLRAAELTQRITHSEDNDTAALVRELCQLYTRGADIDWPLLYRNERRRKVSLPGYPFEKNRCWLDRPNTTTLSLAAESSPRLHPLVDRLLVATHQQDIYETVFDVTSHWELHDHIIYGKPTIPGTTYVEMARFIGEKMFPGQSVEISKLVFLTPMSVAGGPGKRAHLIVSKSGKQPAFSIVSCSEAADDSWTVHAEGMIQPTPSQPVRAGHLEQLKSRIGSRPVRRKQIAGEATAHRPIAFGPRWSGIDLHEWFQDEEEWLGHLQLSESLLADLPKYGLHPSLLDVAVTSGSGFWSDGFYLPLKYDSICIYGDTPSRFYAHYKTKAASVAAQGDKETISYDVTLYRENGEPFVEIANFTMKKVRSAESLNSDDANWFHRVGWVESPLDDVKEVETFGTVVVFREQSRLCERFVTETREQGSRVIEVAFDRENRIPQEDVICITGDAESYQWLMEQLQEVNGIVYFRTAAGTEADEFTHFKQSQQQGAYSLFHLTKQLRSFQYPVKLLFIAQGVHTVTGLEPLHPYAASLFGVSKVVRQEYPGLVCQNIDIDAETEVADLWRELAFEGKRADVSFRSGKRYVEQFETVQLAELSDHEQAPASLRNNGIYVITGGAGGLGLETAYYLASCSAKHIALINRSAFPDRTTWDAILSSGTDDRLKQRISRIREIEALGAHIHCYASNVASPDDMTALFQELRQQFGSVAGVVHSAGVAGGNMIHNRKETDFTSVLQPKAEGVWLLDQLTEGDDLDFMIYYSSITGLFGYIGQCDYTAGNAFLDAYARYRARKGKRTLSINWPAWQELGMAFDHEVDNEKGIFQSIRSRDAFQQLDLLWRKDISNAAIVELNYAQISPELPFDVLWSPGIKAKAKKGKVAPNPAPAAEQRIQTQQPVSAVHAAIDHNAIVKQVSLLWSEVLGQAAINPFESFYELGGDSMMAVQLSRKLDEHFPGMVDLADIFTHSSIDKLSRAIAEKQNIQTADDSAVATSFSHHDSLTDIEKQVSLIWSEVLGHPTIDVFESFYELGGDSIMAVQLSRKLEGIFPGAIDLADIFTYPTVRKISSAIAEKLMPEQAGIYVHEAAAHAEQPELDDILELLEQGKISTHEAAKMMGR
ncbi:type I polyketide synthase [Paenibacillus radicis (ex Gao et al. 2016)]|uniref:Polyketide synthase n=1 Tax=Paenibacillus radicis (ex Gao et al. 2016) TaxID=1737354 RepID=A0A917HVF0_9BACL|nr:type I polyketide synthase [Paenibacillus radicis (ex Gao et al. 2016)]GGG90890.1 hypothetical protein GCM10010918_57400 [Paenibacillus radicis (ex Gao et al. 2016)]